jgi:hypothetical protein
MNKAANTPLSTAIFERIVNDAKHPKSKTTADRIRDACDYLIENRIAISIPEVGRLCNHSGPKAQSIRNNKLLAAYVKARSSEQSLPQHPKSGQARYTTSDVQVNAIIHALEVEASRERSQKENLTRALRDLGDYDLQAVLQTGRLVQFKPAAPMQLDLSSLAKCLLNPNHLQKFGLILEDQRIICRDRNNRVFLEKTEVQQLVRIIEDSRSR